jgi:hypothetical protein
MARCVHGFETSVVRCPSCRDQAPIRKAYPTKGHVPDLTGKEQAGVLVLERTPNVKGETRWNCRFPCGHEKVIAGAHLRAQVRSGGVVVCLFCREANPSRDVVRRQRLGIPSTGGNSRKTEFESGDT